MNTHLISDLPAVWPAHIPADRYGGDGVSWSLQRLAESDRLALQRLYAAMLELLGSMPDDPLDTEAHLERLLGWVELYHWNQLRRDVAAMGPIRMPSSVQTPRFERSCTTCVEAP